MTFGKEVHLWQPDEQAALLEQLAKELRSGNLRQARMTYDDGRLVASARTRDQEPDPDDVPTAEIKVPPGGDR